MEKNKLSTVSFWFLKVLFAGGLALILLNVLAYFYYYTPGGITNKTHSTDLVNLPNSYYSNLREGFGFGHYDQNGYNNCEPYTLSDHPDILLMGSSQMEANQVQQTQTTAYLLNQKLNGLSLYNIGKNAHELPTLINNLSSAIQTYNPDKYIILETQQLNFSKDTIESVITGKMQRREYHADSLLKKITYKLPYFVMLYNGDNLSQLANFIKGQNEEVSEIKIVETKQQYYDKIEKMLAFAADQSNGKQLIIMYHPHLILNKSGGG